jgi:hypothetical protein
MTDTSRFRHLGNAPYRRFRAPDTQPVSLRRICQGLLAGLMLIVLLNGYAFGIDGEIDLAKGIVWLRRARTQPVIAAVAGERLARACRAAEGTRDAALPGCLTPP